MNARTMPIPRTLDTDASRTALPAAAFVVLWSTGYIAGKVAVSHAGPFTSLAVRFTGAALLFALVVLLRRPQWPRIGVLWHSAVVGFLNQALQFGGVYAAFALGANSGFAALVIGSMPLAVSITAAALGEKQPVSRWIGLLIGFVGVLLVLQDRLGSGVGSVGAAVALLLGLCGITFGTLYQKRHATSVDLSIGLLVQNVAAALAVLPVASIHEHLRMDAGAALGMSLLWLILVNSGGTFALLFVLLRQGAATKVATLFYLVTPVTAILGWALMNESMSANKLVGFALAAVGVYIGTRNGATTAAPSK